MIDVVEVDILVLGAGGAGLCAGLHAADTAPTLSIAVVVKGLFGRAGCTRMVQGGYNAVLTPPDSLEAHLTDTLEGGGWINDQEMVWRLVTEAPGARARAGVALRVSLRPQRRGAHSPEAVRGPDARPHRPQGRPHRHRDHGTVSPSRRRRGRRSAPSRSAARWSCCTTTPAARPAR